MWNAIVVDCDYGSVSRGKLEFLKQQYQRNDIIMRMEHLESPEDIVACCGDADAILCTGNPPITRAVLEQLPRLKLVQRFGIGVDSIDIDAATEQGVIVQYMPGYCVQELALHAAAIILDLLRNISYGDRGVRKGEWRKAVGFTPRNPGNMTLGLYGFGGSAKALCNIFYHGFGSRIIKYDPYVDNGIKENFDIESVDFETLLEQSDIISLHAPGHC